MNVEVLHKELKFRTSRSSGSGGQHVNKVSTRVELIFDLHQSELLSPEQKARLSEALKNKLTNEGQLVISCQATRSQHRNRKKAIEKFDALITKALMPVAKRKPVKPLQSDKAKRLDTKRKHSEKKNQRKKVILYE